MENLWAPWRMEYIEKVDNGDDCFLCSALAAHGREREKLVLFRGEHGFCVLNRFPYSNGHILVAPNSHKGVLAELTDDEALELHWLTTRSMRALEAAMRPHGFNVGLNLGRPAGAGLPGHLHWHVVPRWQGDTNFMAVIGDVKVIPQSLDRTWEILSDLFRRG